MPAPLVAPLIEAQGSMEVFGSIGVDEENVANPGEAAFRDTSNSDDARTLPGFLMDKYYRALFRARVPSDYGFYGASDVLRDHYQHFYDSLDPVSLVRCKNYCAPVVEVSSAAELHEYLAEIPLHHEDGLFFRGQRRLYPLDRDPRIQRMLFSDSCNIEPSLTTSASRDPEYDYDSVHYALKHFLEQSILARANGPLQLRDKWREESSSPLCKLDYAVMALAQHYGLPSHGLDVTSSEDIALWFALNHFVRDAPDSPPSYARLDIEDWPVDSSAWPVVIACQTVTHSIGQSLHNCEELAEFGFEARRPSAQQAQFFHGGHSDHQNRLAEAVVCVFRLSPNAYETRATFDSLFPRPEEDSAYQLMLEFRDSPIFGPIGGHFVNRFHSAHE